MTLKHPREANYLLKSKSSSSATLWYATKRFHIQKQGRKEKPKRPRSHQNTHLHPSHFTARRTPYWLELAGYLFFPHLVLKQGRREGASPGRAGYLHTRNHSHSQPNTSKFPRPVSCNVQETAPFCAIVITTVGHKGLRVICLNPNRENQKIKNIIYI